MNLNNIERFYHLPNFSLMVWVDKFNRDCQRISYTVAGKPHCVLIKKKRNV